MLSSLLLIDNPCFIYADKPDNIQFTSPKLKPVNGNNVALTCSSTGVPAPKYRIYKIIRGTSTLIVDSATGNYTITRISYADYGGYNATIRCIPHNSVGDGPSKDLHLDIQGKVTNRIKFSLLSDLSL